MGQKLGKLIVVDGGDGSTKETQAKILLERLLVEGYKAVMFDFPRYGHPASYSVGKYLQKRELGFDMGYGPASNVNPYGASVLYAADRFDAAFCEESKPNMWDHLKEGTHIVSNRYTQSNIGYQASKFDNPEERGKFINWLLHFEYEILGIPKPDLVLILDLDPEVARELKAKQRKDQGQSLDAHESNVKILDKAREVYLEAASMFPDTWSVIEIATKAHPVTSVLGGMDSREVIHNKIWARVKDLIT